MVLIKTIFILLVILSGMFSVAYLACVIMSFHQGDQQFFKECIINFSAFVGAFCTTGSALYIVISND